MKTRTRSTKSIPSTLIAVLTLSLGCLGAVHAETHTIQRGETLYSIAKAHGISVAALKRANGLASDLIKAAETLRIPTIHVVKPGETLSSIGRRYGIPAAKIQALNGIAQPRLLKVGTKLRLKAESGTKQQKTGTIIG